MKLRLAFAALAALGLSTAVTTIAAKAQGLVDPSREGYLEAFKGKKVAFVPISMGFDLAQAWSSQLEGQAKELGYEYIVRDPNWSTDAGAQAIKAIKGEVVSVHVIARPHADVEAVLPKKK